ncbi:hypothetical protein EGW08_009437 [Elysia chlorotica]|uniref:Major facilitator superfamily (MFS) profile domain-containing protein n=1 Tax=Elysia chlorotica TaxID=188477 RepID=A0A433TMK1_ELYCH|nr:hypothetical protein EGW08_009437 [Elysia chlorotica]
MSTTEGSSQHTQSHNGHSPDGKKVDNGENEDNVDVPPSTETHNTKNGAVNGNAAAASADDDKLDGSVPWKAPDGGWGWVVVVCALMISLIVDGLTYTFGLFLGQFERAFNAPKSTVALASSLQVGIYLMIGPVVSALTNRYGCRVVIIAGSLIAAFAYLISSASENVVVLILTYGFLGGVGFGLMYLPSIVSVSVYFEEKRALATGIAVCGSGVGMFVLAPVTEWLLDAFNWRWTLVLLGGLILNGMVFGALVRPLWAAGPGEDVEDDDDQIIGSGGGGGVDDDTTNQFGSQRSRKGSVGSSTTGNSRKESSISRQQSVSSAGEPGNKDSNTEAGLALIPLMEGVESITVEVIEEPVSRKPKHPKKYSHDEDSAHLLKTQDEPVVNFSSSPAIVSF